MTPQQMAFDLGGRETYARSDFFPSPANAAGWRAVDEWQGWPQGRMLLIGPGGAGKTHLCHIWAETAGAGLIAARDLSTVDPTALPPFVAVDDADAVAGTPALEEALFHLFNAVMAAGGRLLLTARTPPRDWGLRLPDLLSRMQAMPVARLDPPDDALLTAILVKLFADRQIAVAPNLIPYLASRMERSISAARQLVAALDARALADGRPITRALAADVLDSSRNG